METNEIKLLDYFRVIWRQKILIIVGALVCMVAAGIVNLFLPVKYRSFAIISIGKVISGPQASVDGPQPSAVGYFPSLASVETTQHFVKTFPLKYSINNKEGVGYRMDAEMVGVPNMVKVIVEGPGMGTEEILKEFVNTLVGEHLEKLEASTIPYYSLLKELKNDIVEIQEDIAMVEANMNIKESADVESVHRGMWYEGMSNMELLRENRRSLREMKQQLIMYQAFLGGIKKKRTMLFGEVKNTVARPNKIRSIMLGGVVGLIMSLFLAFFIEYLRKARILE